MINFKHWTSASVTSIFKKSLVMAMGLFLFSSVSAQEGHPLKGSWIGEWESNEALGEFILLVMDWDGESVNGTINPGTDNLNIESATIDPESWTITIEAGDYQIEGVIEDLGLPSRSIVGSWKSSDGSGNFSIARQ